MNIEDILIYILFLLFFICCALDDYIITLLHSLSNIKFCFWFSNFRSTHIMYSLRWRNGGILRCMETHLLKGEYLSTKQRQKTGGRKKRSLIRWLCKYWPRTQHFSSVELTGSLYFTGSPWNNLQFIESRYENLGPHWRQTRNSHKHW